MTDPIGFAELGRVEGLFEPDESAIETADVAGCPLRGEETVSKAGVFYAECAVLSREAGRSVGVDRRTCQICICHGPAEPTGNPYLQKHIVQCAYSGTIAAAGATEALAPSDGELDTAVANVKRFRGAEVAKRFVDALVYNESITPGKAAELVETHELAGD
jgi:hypothetical protein